MPHKANLTEYNAHNIKIFMNNQDKLIQNVLTLLFVGGSYLFLLYWLDVIQPI